MVEIFEFWTPLTDQRRNDLLFKGNLVIFRQVDPMLELCRLSDKLIREYLPADPQHAHQDLPRMDYLERVGKLQPAYRKQAWVKALLSQTLKEVGANLETTFWDRFILRAVPHGHSHEGSEAGSLGFHRDSWGANMYHQINWWAPIYTVCERNTIALYPDYWERPIRNTTASWRYKDYVAARRNTHPGQEIPYPPAPVPLEPIDTSNAVCPVLSTGDVLCFASAHLHASVPNISGLTRFSVELRTNHLADILAGRGAPNIDCANDQPMTGWFRRVTDNRVLTQVLAEKTVSKG